MEVVAGVDSHKSTFAASVVDLIGRPVEARQFENTPEDHEEFLAWARSRGRGRARRRGVLGAVVAGLTRYLIAAGEDVREVPTRFAYREAKRRHAQGKSDPGDALSIARVVAREERLPSPRRPQIAEDLKHPSRGRPGKVDASEVELLTMRGLEHLARSTEENAFP